MKRLSDFKDEKAITVVAKLIPPVVEVVTNSENAKLKNEKNPMVMFSGFFSNSPRSMMDIFAVLSEEDPKDFHCDGVDVAKGIITLASDPRIVDLFTSQGQTGDATSSGSASGSTEGH